MKALRFDEEGLRVAEVPTPSRAGEALVRVTLAGVCNTDLEIARGYAGFEGTLGHEFVGVVESAPGAPELVGRREINAVCGVCAHCRGGRPTHCANRTVLGILNRDGAFAEYTCLPWANLHRVPDNVPGEAAVFTEPLAAALEIVERAHIRPTERVAVIGDGKLGLLCAQVLRLPGCEVVVVGRHPERWELLHSLGIATVHVDQNSVGEGAKGRRGEHAATSPARPLARSPQSFDVVVDCTGSASGFELAMAMVRPRGAIVLKSTVAQGKPLNLAPLVIDEIQVLGSRCGPFREAIKALAAKEVDVASLIHRRMKLDQGVEAMNLAGRPGVLKVILTMD